MTNFCDLRSRIASIQRTQAYGGDQITIRIENITRRQALQSFGRPYISFHSEQAITISKLRAAPAPSTVIRPREFEKHQRSGLIHNGRPDTNKGMPIQLYHPIFGSVQASLRNEAIQPTAQDCELVVELLSASSGNYNIEEDRKKAIDSKLSFLLGRSAIPKITSGDKSNADGAIAAPGGPYMFALDMKNDIGTGGGPPDVQAPYFIAKQLAYESFVK